MKKAYSKPEIAFEDFTMSTNIALGCKQLVNYAENTCAVTTTDAFGVVRNVFTGSACTTIVPDGYNGLCYHVPESGIPLFTS